MMIYPSATCWRLSWRGCRLSCVSFRRQQLHQQRRLLISPHRQRPQAKAAAKDALASGWRLIATPTGTSSLTPKTARRSAARHRAWAPVLEEVGLPARSTVELSTDNTGARDLAYDPEHHDRTKHIERRHFFIRELVEEKHLVVSYVNTVDNIADFFTKALAAKTFYQLRNKIMNIDRSRSDPLPALTTLRDALPSVSLDPSPGGVL